MLITKICMKVINVMTSQAARVGTTLHEMRLYALNLKHKGKNVFICKGYKFFCSENISIGDNVYIGPDSWINAMGEVIIRNGTIIGPRLTVYSANHRFRNANAIPYDGVVLTSRIEIGENVWIGGNVIILPGVTIGEGCIIGAGSVVAKEIAPFSIVVGNPANVIGKRDKDHYLKLKINNQIYYALKAKGEISPRYEKVT